ncbi:hypothetical protein GUJ93_ZPchr0013g37797 [Zizania palustris]|uniref:Uncharacterized protein n=1 Tax=Zizania palustris TaxID=103762 RepID=A0A8J5XA39_ZIZPA|nr:hypothetical protein GUJ93_ZPchr0013g37797 [Zizania palustris]
MDEIVDIAFALTHAAAASIGHWEEASKAARWKQQAEEVVEAAKAEAARVSEEAKAEAAKATEAQAKLALEVENLQ